MLMSPHLRCFNGENIFHSALSGNIATHNNDSKKTHTHGALIHVHANIFGGLNISANIKKKATFGVLRCRHKHEFVFRDWALAICFGLVLYTFWIFVFVSRLADGSE